VKSLLSLVDELWNSGWYEELSVAVELLVEYVDMLTSREFPYFIKLADEAETWALVDPMSIQVMGKLVMKDPGLENSWQQMAKHENFWVRRAAILTHIAFFRSGRCNLGHFEAMVVPMFEEDSSWTKQERFFIRKAIGWSLREVAVREPEQVVNFVMHHGREMSGLTHREATRRLPESMKQLF
jgi:3-methyladenine DNA glycosylase AlkD